MAEVSEGLISCLEEFVAVLFCDVQNIIGFVAAEAFGEGKFQRVEPELRGAVVSLNVDVRGSNLSAM